MNVNFSFSINTILYKKDPEETTIGREIVRHSIELIEDLGIDEFTFKKLSIKIHHSEATIYRYFENKQMLLLYIVSWYWHYLNFLIEYRTQNMMEPKQKVEEVIGIFSENLNKSKLSSLYNLGAIFHIVIREGNKVYMNPDVTEINKTEAFKPYKDLCAKLSGIFLSYNPSYKYAHSLASTLVETSHMQIYFANHLPSLTDVKTANKNEYIYQFLSHFIFQSLN